MRSHSRSPHLSAAMVTCNSVNLQQDVVLYDLYGGSVTILFSSGSIVGLVVFCSRDEP